MDATDTPTVSDPERSREDELIACRLVARSAGQSVMPSVDQLSFESAMASVFGSGHNTSNSALGLRCTYRGCGRVFGDHTSLARHLESGHMRVSGGKPSAVTNLLKARTGKHFLTAKGDLIAEDEDHSQSNDYSDQVFIKQEMDYSDPSLNEDRDMTTSRPQEDPNTSQEQEMIWVNHPRSGRIARPKKYNARDNSVAKPIEGTLDTQLRQAIINLKWYFQVNNPEWKKKKVLEEISSALQISLSSVSSTVKYSKKHGTVKEKRTVFERAPKFVCNPDDRRVLEQCIYKLKNQNRLNSALDVYNEINSSNELPISFKGCSKQTFYKIFNKSGFRITETMIVNQRPSLAEGRTSTDLKVDGQWQCVWPACDKRFKDKKHLTDHTRTHTQEKPFECRQPGCDYRCTQYGNFLKHLKVHKITLTKNMTVERTESHNITIP